MTNTNLNMRRIPLLVVAIFATLILSACGPSCDSHDSQGWCGKNTGAGKTEYSR